jgi:hypothetical protein
MFTGFDILVHFLDDSFWIDQKGRAQDTLKESALTFVG